MQKYKNNMLNFVTISFLVFFVQGAEDTVKYVLENNYTKYVEMFREVAGDKNTIDVSHYGTGKEICYEQACKYYIFVHEPENSEGTILLTAGLHGKQKIGPISALYSYNFLKQKTRHRIIFFPIANPSGYIRSQRLTYPNKLDPNRDYPIDHNIDCYEASATRIIDGIFRNYSIDLTINLHNGGNEIGWNWGTIAKFRDSHTEDYDIYFDAGKMLQFYGGQNKKIEMNKMKIGTMSESIYPANGTLDDWAYGGSWDTSVPLKCKKYQFDAYPKNMHHGLVFLFELGRFDITDQMLGTSDGLAQDPAKQSEHNGFVARTLRILQQIVYFVDPVCNISIKDNVMNVEVIGCNTVTFNQFSLRNQKDEKIFQALLTLEKSETPAFIHSQTLEVSQNLVQPDFALKYKFTCDQSWLGKGHSVFSKPRIYEGKQVVQLNKPSETKESDISPSQPKETQKKSYLFIFLAMMMSIIIIVSIFRAKTHRHERFKSLPLEIEQIQSEERVRERVI